MIAQLFRSVLSGVAILALVGGVARAQEPSPPPMDQRLGPDLSPAEVERLFQAYAIVQAQEMLNLNDAQYGQFVTRLRVLQETRRRTQQARNGILQELRRLTQPDVPAADETMIRDRLKALSDLDVRAAAELRKAYEAIDQVLDVRQQARFRVFEERLERQKLDLLMRARQGQRPPPNRRVPQRPPG